MDLSATINQEASVSNLMGINPGGARLNGYEGQQLPASTYTGSDGGAVWWSPDSPLFWGAVVGAATLLGLLGASVQFRAGKTRARAQVGND